MNIVGTIELIRQSEQFKSGSYKRSLVIKTDEQYPQILEVEFWNDKADQIAMLEQGEKVSIDANLNGRLWQNPQGKQVVFMSLSGYKLELLSGSASQAPKQAKPRPMGNIESNFQEDAIRDMQEDDDDFPF
jgi:single-stranded DNA-binding protein